MHRYITSRSIRQFSTTKISYGIRTKAKINVALNKEAIPIDQKHLEETLKRKQKDFNNTPVKNVSAQKLLSQLLGREFNEDEIIGPNTVLTAKELNIIFNQNNIRLTYKVLGTSGRQVQDSLIVDEDVQKFLKKDDLLRAKQLAKLARHQGLFAYGTILRYLLKRNQVNDAFDIFMDLKKRGYRLNGRLYNILISGYADAISRGGKADISQQKIEQLYRSFQKDHENYNPELSIFHVNSLLKVFRKGKRVDLALNLYDSLKHVRSGKLRIKPEIRTYTEMLRILSGAKRTVDDDGENKVDLDFTDIVNRAEVIFFNAQHNRHIKIDSYLVRAYVSLYAYCDDLELRARAIRVLLEWFRLSSLEEIKQEIDFKNYDEEIWAKNIATIGNKALDKDENITRPRLLAVDEINVHKTKRFEPDEAVLRMYRELCTLFKLPCTYKEKGDK